MNYPSRKLSGGLCCAFGTVLTVLACGSPAETPEQRAAAGSQAEGGHAGSSGSPNVGSSGGGSGSGSISTAGAAGTPTTGLGGVSGSMGAGGSAGAPGGGGSPPLPRPLLPGAVLWLEAAEVDTLEVESEHVSKWRDLSEQHNDAAQPSANVRPVLVAASDAKPAVVHFTAQQHTFLGIPDAPSLQFGKQDFTIAVVFAFTNQPFANGAPGVHLGGWAFALNKITQPSGPRVGWGIMGNWPNGETSPVRTAVGCETTEAGGVVLTKMNGYNDGALRLWVMRRDTARGAVELRGHGVVDGTGKGGTYLDDVSTVGTPITLGGARLNPGGMNNAGFSLEGDIAAAVVVKGALADPDLAMLEQYLIKKYRLAIP